MFRLTRPTPATCDAALAAARGAPFTYAEVGATRAGPGAAPPGYAVNHRRALVGAGASVYARAVAALRSWRMAQTPFTSLHPPDAPVAEGVTVAVVAGHFGFWSVQPARVVYVQDEVASEAAGGARCWGFAYGTVPGHAAAGEERFLVEQDADGRVWYDLYSFSRPRHPLMRLGAPVARRLQRRFARESAGAMARAVARTAAGA